MEENFKKFRNQLAKGEGFKNPLLDLRDKYNSKQLDFYDFIDQMVSYSKTFYQFSDYLINTGVSKIEIMDNAVLFTTRDENIKVVFNGKDRRGVPFEILGWGAYEKQEMNLFNKIISDGMTILDIGANIGWYSLLWSKKFPNAKIHAFEPIEDTYRYLVTNITLNGAKNIELNNFGLSNRNELVDFFYYPEGSCLASTKNILRYEKASKVKGQLKTLDSILDNFKEGIDLIKCDVEGAELDVILGAVNAINRHVPIIVLELFHEWSSSFDYHPDQAIKLLHSYGYTAFLPLEGCLQAVENYISDDFERQNYFFLHRERHKALITKMHANNAAEV